MSFFDSQQVKDSIDEIQKLQGEVYQASVGFYGMTTAQRVEHIDKMEILLEKQRILHTRMELDPDPAAKEMLNKMRKVAVGLGIPEEISFNELFQQMEHIIKTMKMGGALYMQERGATSGEERATNDERRVEEVGRSGGSP